MGKRLSILLIFSVLAGLRAAEDDLAQLSDEFNYLGTLTNWQRIYQLEGWGNDVLETFDIDTTRPGRMFMMPYSSSWYEEYRGELTFKNVTGDFVITTDVEPRRRNGIGAPQSQYSLAGIMVRTPRTMTSPTEWTPAGQNYVFLSLGAADTPGTYQYEVKTTVNSASTLHITEFAPARAAIQVARLGPHLIMLRRDSGGTWQVHRRYYRADMPDGLQAGLTVYTDWPLCSEVGVENQNTLVLTNGTMLPGGGIVSEANPDLAAAFDYVRYHRPTIPPHLVGAELSNPGAVSDAELLSFLGDHANIPYLPAPLMSRPTQADAARVVSEGFPLHIQAAPGLSCTLEASNDLDAWLQLTNFPGTGRAEEILDPAALEHPFRFYRVRVTP